MKHTGKSFLSFLLVMIMLCAVSVPAFAEESTSRNFTVVVDGESHNLRGFDVEYAGNAYVSLRDLAVAFADTEKKFSLDIYESEIYIYTGGNYVTCNGDGSQWNSPGNYYYPTLKRNALYLDDTSLRYYTMIAAVYTGVYDCWIRISDFAMIMDCAASVSGSTVYLSTTEPFSFDMQKLESEGYFEVTNAVLCADATTGEIFYSWNADLDVPIASTTKLMTYLVVMDAITNGEVSWNDRVVISANASALSTTQDYQIMMDEGEVTNIYELLCGMLLPSSNECALALAEHVSGSESAFVDRMNARAAELGLTTAQFHNSNGLPSYLNNAVNAKLQNRMSANDMLKLVSYILQVYPQITDITSQKEIELDTLGITVHNSNPLLYNMDGIVGLKTGTTGQAGYCLVAAKPVELADGQHMLITVEFGAESSSDRGQVSELLMRYAQQCAEGENITPVNADEDELPQTAEAFIQTVVNAGRAAA